MRTCLSISSLLPALALAGCSADPGPRKLLPDSEPVLREGMTVTATNAEGTVTIEAGKGTERTYSGKDWKRTLRLVARARRWGGSLGLYDPADSFSPYGRLLPEEGLLFFSSEEEMLQRFYKSGSKSQPVYTDHGLVVGYHEEPIPGGESVHEVELWQVYIRGRRPRSLRGARDSAIKVTGGEIPDTATPHAAKAGFDQNAWTRWREEHQRQP